MAESQKPSCNYSAPDQEDVLKNKIKYKKKSQVVVPKPAHGQLLPSCSHNPMKPTKNALIVKYPAHCHGVVQGLGIGTPTLCQRGSWQAASPA